MNAGVTEKAMLYSRSRFSWELSEIGAAKPDRARLLREAPAAFRRLCVETIKLYKADGKQIQPPSGGCVLKPAYFHTRYDCCCPAAFRRLCVETITRTLRLTACRPAAFRRLCVETRRLLPSTRRARNQPPSGGCVLKRRPPLDLWLGWSSRLQAAVC